MRELHKKHYQTNMVNEYRSCVLMKFFFLQFHFFGVSVKRFVVVSPLSAGRFLKIFFRWRHRKSCVKRKFVYFCIENRVFLEIFIVCFFWLCNGCLSSCFVVDVQWGFIWNFSIELFWWILGTKIRFASEYTS